MNGNKYIRLAITVLTGAQLIFSTLPAGCEEPATMQYTVIRLLANDIVPSLATINQGTVIIWLNEAPETAEVQFTNNDISPSCNGASPLNDQMKQVMAFQIAFGKVESICLVQKGEFTYTVKRGSQSLTGKIRVK